MNRAPKGFTETYGKSLSADCDLDLLPSNVVFIRDTSSGHDDHLCQICFPNDTMQDEVMGQTRF